MVCHAQTVGMGLNNPKVIVVDKLKDQFVVNRFGYCCVHLLAPCGARYDFHASGISKLSGHLVNIGATCEFLRPDIAAEKFDSS